MYLLLSCLMSFIVDNSTMGLGWVDTDIFLPYHTLKHHFRKHVRTFRWTILLGRTHPGYWTKKKTGDDGKRILTQAYICPRVGHVYFSHSFWVFTGAFCRHLFLSGKLAVFLLLFNVYVCAYVCMFKGVHVCAGPCTHLYVETGRTSGISLKMSIQLL